MATAAKVGSNFTGVQMSPKDTKRLLDAVNEIHPDVPGDERGMLVERTERAAEADRIGSVPVPGSAKGMLKTGFDMMRGKSPEVFLDTPDTALVDTLMHIRNEEHEHMMLVHQAIESLGADPTAQTPCADVVGAMALGIVNVLTDPRTNVPQCLNALLTAELADNAAWELLIELAQAAGHPNIADSFTKAKTQEDDHLVKIKTLMRRDLIMQTK